MTASNTVNTENAVRQRLLTTVAQNDALNKHQIDATSLGNTLKNKLVAEIAEFAAFCEQDDEHREAALRLADERDVPRPGANHNRFLLYVRLTCGAMKDGKWQFNRSAERYAGVLRWASENSVSPSELQSMLDERKELRDGNNKFKAGIVSLLKQDQKAHGETRASIVFPHDVKKKALSVPAIARVELTAELKKQFEQSEGFALAVVRFANGHLEILGDAGKRDNEVYRPVTALMSSKFKEVAMPTSTSKKKVAA